MAQNYSYMKASIIFLLFVLNIGIVKGSFYSNDYLFEKNDTSYLLMPSIIETCKNIVVTDSMFRAWNQSSMKNMSKTGIENNYRFLQYKKGENYRLEFCKVINNDSLVSEQDTQNGFFIVEKITEGSYMRHDNYLFVDRDGGFNVFHYRFSNREITWLLMREMFLIDKKDFTRFCKKVKKQRQKDHIYPIVLFNVTEFSNIKIDSFISIENGCKDCIDLFEQITKRLNEIN